MTKHTMRLVCNLRLNVGFSAYLLYVLIEIFEGNNALMTMSLNVKFLYDSKLNLHLFISCNGYTLSNLN